MKIGQKFIIFWDQPASHFLAYHGRGSIAIPICLKKKKHMNWLQYRTSKLVQYYLFLTLVYIKPTHESLDTS